MLKTALRFSHQLLEEIVVEGDTVVDATMGNGHDTLFLAKMVGKTGCVYAFDIQEQAIHNTTQLLRDNHLINRTNLCLQGHETMDEVLMPEKKIKAAIFNLGYLPKGDKSIVTSSFTTIKAIVYLLEQLEKKGRIILVIYDGHDEGKKEKKEIIDFVSTLEQNQFSVLNYQFINQKNNPPSLICIEKKNSTK